jgi:menaquinone-dependent protoporphyrinogen IX oxidase
MTTNNEGAANQRVLVVYYSFSEQARKVSKAMTKALEEAGCEVTETSIEFTDSRYTKNFVKFPMGNAYVDLFRMLPSQLRRATGQIRIPEQAKSGDYDLVIFGSPTWWLTTCMPIRSYLKSPEAQAVLNDTPFGSYVVCRRYWGNNQKTVKRLGTKAGGKWVDGLHFAYQGGQIRSLLSLISYLGSGEYKPKYFGVKIPPTNLTDGFDDVSEKFARQLITTGSKPSS